MRIYKLSLDSTSDPGCSGGFHYVSSKRDIPKARKEYPVCEVTEIEVEISKAGILRALNIYASHPDNG